MNSREKAYAVAQLSGEEVRFPSVAMTRVEGKGKKKKKLKAEMPNKGKYA